ncbi:MAG: 4-alpha-glucanotransferase [Acidimicrobiales bacterium]
MESSFTDAFGQRKRVNPATLLAVLQSLGVPIESEREAGEVLERDLTGSGEVVVAWDGRLVSALGPRSPLAAKGAVDELALTLEDGGDASELVELRHVANGPAVVSRGPLPFGVHRLELSSSLAPVALVAVTVISAPRRAPPLVSGAYGLFAPTYALVDERGLERGDLSSLRRLCAFAGPLGASYVATLPLLAAGSREGSATLAPSPYSPLSRLWWDESYLDWSRVAELSDLPGGPLCERASLRTGSHRLDEKGGARLAQFERFVAEHPSVLEYASFRAAIEVAGREVARWPAPWQRATIGAAGLDARSIRAYAYAQFAMDEQLAELANLAAAAGTGLILDLPVGCSADGYDPWANPHSFAKGMHVGAPPDMFFAGGQDWGFPPLHPVTERASGYPVFRGALSHLSKHARAIRIDHAMGLQRLWWIPEGAGPSEGAYVSYEKEEQIALCCLEAWRSGTALIGEDLGTVEAPLRELLSDHCVAGMHVAVFDLQSRTEPVPLSPAAGSVAMVDTHDTATFAGWFLGLDIDERERLGLTSASDATSERRDRRSFRHKLVERLVASGQLEEMLSSDPVAVHAGLLDELAGSRAGLILVNLEDLWGETDPVNIPGTTATEHANFSRLLARSLPEIETDPAIAATLERVARRRKEGAASQSGELTDAARG